MATPIPGSKPHLEVTFANNLKFDYTNPTPLVCMSFQYCHHLQLVRKVAWYQVPLDEVAVFFDFDNCMYRNGKPTLHSAGQRLSVDGWHTFKPFQRIRSLMYGPNLNVKPPRGTHIPVVRSCAFQATERATVGSNETWNGTTEEVTWISYDEVAGGLSSNWTEPLPDELKSSDYDNGTVGENESNIVTMERANPFELQVVFEKGAYFSYVDPSKSVCIQLSDCDDWKAASKVVWKNLPADWSVEFFLKNGCNHNDADVYFWTTKGVSIGVYTFKKPQAVRSIYARPLYGRIPYGVARKCVQLRQLAEDALLGNDTSSDEVVGSSEDGNISANWFDPVDEEDAGSAGMEWKTIPDAFMND